jgi:DNA-binding SARP family transcriptional activator
LVALRGIKPKAVIAVLLMHANEPVSAERLALALWGEEASRSAIKTVRVHVSRLRKALGDPDILTTTPAGYRLRVRRGELDAHRFEDLVEDGRRALADGQPDEAAAILCEALALWRGPALAEVALEPFAGIEVARLEEQRLAALELRVQADLVAGRHREIVAELQRLVVDHPTREQLTGQLMLALYRSDRQTAALETYATARRILVNQVGVEPGPMLRDLHRAILEHDVTLLDQLSDTELPPARDVNWRALPKSLKSAAASAFVGRDAELADLRERWTQMSGGGCVAVLVGGEAGIGKTRLAAALAQVVHREGGLVLYGRCDEGLAMPYQPFVEALRPYVGAIGRGRLRAEIGELAPELGRLLPELRLGEPVRSDPESERMALFESVAALIEAATLQQRTLLVLDDLHWATGQTLLLVRHLIRCERPLRVLLLCTYRETELDLGQPLAQLLADLHRDAAVELLRLRGLGQPAITTLLEAAVGHELDDHVSPLVQVLADQTRGNPVLLARAVGRRGRVKRHAFRG